MQNLADTHNAVLKPELKSSSWPHGGSLMFGTKILIQHMHQEHVVTLMKGTGDLAASCGQNARSECCQSKTHLSTVCCLCF